MSDWEENTPPKKQSLNYFASGMQNVWELLGKEKNRIKLVTLLTLLTQVLDIGIPYILKLIFDELPNITVSGQISNYLIMLIISLFVVRVMGIVIVRFVKEPMLLKSLIYLEN